MDNHSLRSPERWRPSRECSHRSTIWREDSVSCSPSSQSLRTPSRPSKRSSMSEVQTQLRRACFFVECEKIWGEKKRRRENKRRTQRLILVLLLLLVKLALLLCGGVLVLLVLGDKVVHVGLSLGELHLIHTLASVPVKEGLAA